eukprot:tig00020538_g10316.t1
MGDEAVGEPAITVLSQSQVEELHEAFKAFCEKGTETLSTNNIGTVLRSVLFTPTEAELEQMKKELTENGHDLAVPLTWAEFCECVERYAQYNPHGPALPKELLLDAFRVFDKDGQGYITSVELRHILSNLGERLPDEDISEFIAESLGAEAKGDRISYYDVVDNLLKRM